MSIPVIIIGGFLGAGKTTLLNYILGENHGVRAGVLVNDFGAINIDAKLVVGVEGETVNLANGCICCSIRDDLIAACLGLLHQPSPPDLLIIETSGVSDPVQVANTFLMPELQSVLALNSILTVVDGDQFLCLTGESAAMARMQILAADMVVLNKIDLVTGKQRAEVAAAIRDIAPGSRILEVTHGQVPLALMLGAENPGPVDRRVDIPMYGFHDTVPHVHGEVFATWHWTCDRPLSLPRIRSAFEKLGETVYRAKGIVYLEELPAYRMVLQMVGKRSNLMDTGQWESEEPHSEIVMIASQGGIDSDALQRVFDGCIGIGDESQSSILRLTRLLTKDKGRGF